MEMLLSEPSVFYNLLEEEEETSKRIKNYEDFQPEFKPYHRKVLLSWMHDIVETENYATEIFLLSVHYLDAFLSTQVIPKSQFQLTAACCLLLASKYLATDGISGSLLVYYTADSITLHQLLAWEWQVLKSLQWRLEFPTSLTFIHHMVPRIACVSSLNNEVLAGIVEKVKELAMLAACHYDLLLAPRSLIACACLQIACKSKNIGNGRQLFMEMKTLFHFPLEITQYTLAIESLS